jgi:hypothetical protein
MLPLRTWFEADWIWMLLIVTEERVVVIVVVVVRVTVLSRRGGSRSGGKKFTRVYQKRLLFKVFIVIKSDWN